MADPVVCIGAEGNGFCVEGCETECVLARKKPKLEELVAGMTEENRHAEVDLGPAVGREFPNGYATTEQIEKHLATDWYTLAHNEWKDLKDGGRGSYLSPRTDFILDIACGMLFSAFDETCYLVGSATETKQYRDVDVRMIMDDERYDRLFGTSSIAPLWEVTCAGISAWLSSLTGEQVDFQIQRQSNANKRYSGKEGHRRNALGIGYRIRLEGDQLPEFLREMPKPDC